MIHVECPRCGAPTDIALHAQGLTCSHCHYSGDFKPGVAEALASARELLSTLDASQRQLSGQQQIVLRWARVLQVLLGLVFLLGVLSLGSCGACVALDATENPRPMDYFLITGLPSFVPMVMFIVIGVPVLLALGKRRRQLVERSAARPPAQPGQPARCRVCGADIPAADGTQAVVRCGFCGTDNLVSADALARAVARERVGLQELEGALRRESQSVGSITVAGVFALAAVSVLLPIATAVIWFGVIAWAIFQENPVDDGEIQLVVVETDQGRCLALWEPSATPGDQLIAPHPPRPGTLPSPPFSANAMVGQRVRFLSPPAHGTVQRVYSPSLLLEVYLVLDTTSELGDQARSPVTNGICLE